MHFKLMKVVGRHLLCDTLYMLYKYLSVQVKSFHVASFCIYQLKLRIFKVSTLKTCLQFTSHHWKRAIRKNQEQIAHDDIS